MKVNTIPVRKIKSFQNKSNATQGFSVRNIRDILAGKDMVHERHRHEFFFVLALKNASGKHIIDFVPYEIIDYSIFFMRPGQVHELMLNAGATGYLMEFQNDFFYPTDKVLSQLLFTASHMNQCILDAENFTRLYSTLAAIYSEYCDRKEGYLEVIKANLSIFFIELLRFRQQTRSETKSVNKYTREQLDKLQELLEIHISTHKGVAQYAEMMHLSPYQLNAIIKTTMGKTCSELINEYIILESKRYLLATSNLVNQIADHLGYEDVSYFIRFFKKHTGFTPEAFRYNFR